MPDFKAACAYAASLGWLIVEDVGRLGGAGDAESVAALRAALFFMSARQHSTHLVQADSLRGQQSIAGSHTSVVPQFEITPVIGTLGLLIRNLPCIDQALGTSTEASSNLCTW
jgi:hypothetical protein